MDPKIMKLHYLLMHKTYWKYDTEKWPHKYRPQPSHKVKVEWATQWARRLISQFRPCNGAMCSHQTKTQVWQGPASSWSHSDPRSTINLTFLAADKKKLCSFHFYNALTRPLNQNNIANWIRPLYLYAMTWYSVKRRSSGKVSLGDLQGIADTTAYNIEIRDSNRHKFWKPTAWHLVRTFFCKQLLVQCLIYLLVSLKYTIVWTCNNTTLGCTRH